MIVLGFDTSLSVSGCARVDLVDGIASWETWRGRADQPEISTVLSERRRIRVMLREILALVPDRFDLAVVEGASMGGKFRGKADERAALRWFLIDQLIPRGPVVLVAPRTRALLAAGSGSAGKRDVLAAVRDQVPGAHVPDHNVADSVALALAGAHRLGFPVEYSAAQRKSHAAIAWPVITS